MVTEHSSQDIFFMQRALQLAQRAQNLEEVPIGAVAVLAGEIVGEGFNSPISLSDPTAHAEILALRAAGKRLKNYRLSGLSIYVTLEPCMMCLGALLHARVKEIIFGATDPKSGAIIGAFNLLAENKLNHKITYKFGILADQCSKILTDFFQRKRA